MSIALPSQSQSYLGPITDIYRWENFQHRSDPMEGKRRPLFATTGKYCRFNGSNATYSSLSAPEICRDTEPQWRVGSCQLPYS